MKLLRVRVFAVAFSLLLMSIITSSSAIAAENEEYDPRHTMLALNMATVSINHILTTEDRIVLDQEYDNIINNLSLGSIRSDSDIMELYRKIMDTISRKRIRNEEAALLQSRYDRQMRTRLSDALSIVKTSNQDILHSGFLSFLGNLAISCVSSYFVYQDSSEKLREGLRQDTWKLRAADLNDVNEIQKQLLTSSWNLLNQYKLPDNERLVENAIKEFYQVVSTPDNAQRLRMLRELENDFRTYPPYWFYRAKAAREAGNTEEARSSLDRFEESWRPVLRLDPYRLEAAKFRIYDLLTCGRSLEEIREDVLKNLDIAWKNTPRSDWADNLFIGTVFFTLGEKEKGVACVRRNDDFNYEKDISPVILKQMEAGEFDLVALSSELKTLLGIVPAGTESADIHAAQAFQAESEDVEKADGIQILRRGFLSLHSSEWNAMSLNQKLDSTIDTVFDEVVAESIWGVRGFYLAINKDNVAERIQEAINARFAPDYVAFLNELERKYGMSIQADAERFARAAHVGEFLFRVNPMSQARISSGAIAKNRERSLVEQLWGKMDDILINPWWAVTWLAVSLVIFLFRGLIADIISPISYSSRDSSHTGTGLGLGAGIGAAVGSFVPVIGTAIGAAAGSALGGIFGAAASGTEWNKYDKGNRRVRSFFFLIGLAALAWGAYSFYNVAMKTQDSVLEYLHEINQELYTVELPRAYWSAMEPYILEAAPSMRN